MQEIQRLIREIEVYCRRCGIAESTFGRQAINDGKFVSRLRQGKGVTVKTLDRIRAFLHGHPPGGSTAQPSEAGAAQPDSSGPHPGSSPGDTTTPLPQRPFRFYDNRQKYLAFITTCNEKSTIARRCGKELPHLQPQPPALRVFDAGMGDATLLSLLMRDLHRRFSTVPLLVVAKEISLEDVRLGLEKMPDRFFEHPATVLVITNLHYAEAPKLMPADVHTAAALNWHEIRLEGDCAYAYGEQIEALEPLLSDGWQTRTSAKSGNPLYVRPSVLVLYRQDHKFLLDAVIPRPGYFQGHYDFVVASQPWRARMDAEFKARRILAPLTRSLAPGGRLLAIQGSGEDPGTEIIQAIWPRENPFRVNRHQLISTLKEVLGRQARDYNFNALADHRSRLRYSMHTLPSEIGENIGTSTLFAAWNAAIYVNQIEDARLEQALADGRYLEATRAVLHQRGGLWFNDETFVISRRRQK